MALTSEAYEQLSSHVAMLHNVTNIGIIDTDGGIIIIDTAGDDDAGKHILRIIQEKFPSKKFLPQ